jgi:hypothetical protein
MAASKGIPICAVNLQQQVKAAAAGEGVVTEIGSTRR